MSSPSDCVDGYIPWCRRVSHPYIIAAADEERPSLAPKQHEDVPHEAPARRASPPPSGLLKCYRTLFIVILFLCECLFNSV